MLFFIVVILPYLTIDSEHLRSILTLILCFKACLAGKRKPDLLARVVPSSEMHTEMLWLLGRNHRHAASGYDLHSSDMTCHVSSVNGM